MVNMKKENSVVYTSRALTPTLHLPQFFTQITTQKGEAILGHFRALKNEDAEQRGQENSSTVSK